MRQTGRTNRMLIEAVSAALQPRTSIVVVIAHNVPHSICLGRKMTKIIDGLGIDHSYNVTNRCLYFLDKTVYFCGPRVSVNNLSAGRPGEKKVFYDHFVFGDDPEPEEKKKKKLFEFSLTEYMSPCNRVPKEPPPAPKPKSQKPLPPKPEGPPKRIIKEDIDVAGFLRELGIDVKYLLTKVKKLCKIK